MHPAMDEEGSGGDSAGEPNSGLTILTIASGF